VSLRANNRADSVMRPATANGRLRSSRSLPPPRDAFWTLEAHPNKAKLALGPRVLLLLLVLGVGSWSRLSGCKFVHQ